MWTILLWLLPVTHAFPNPMSGEFRACRMLEFSHICDPDEVFSMVDRHRINHELRMLKARTAIPAPVMGQQGCESMGITAAMTVIARGKHEHVNRIGQEMKTWPLDRRCNNTLLIAFAADSFEYLISRDPRYTDLSPHEVAHYLQREARNIAQGNFGRAFLNVLHKTRMKATMQIQRWNESTYPNPTRGHLRACRIPEPGYLCDPDNLLDDEERAVLLDGLKMVERSTSTVWPCSTSYCPFHFNVPNHRNLSFCERKGITPMVALTRHVANSSVEAMSNFSSRLLKTWNDDADCQKSMLILLAFDDDQYSVATGRNVGFEVNVFLDMFRQQAANYARREIVEALKNTFVGVVQAYLRNQTAMITANPPMGSGTEEGGMGEVPGGGSQMGGMGQNPMGDMTQNPTMGGAMAQNPMSPGMSGMGQQSPMGGIGQSSSLMGGMGQSSMGGMGSQSSSSMGGMGQSSSMGGMGQTPSSMPGTGSSTFNGGFL